MPGPANDVAEPDADEGGYAQWPIEPLLSLFDALDDLLPRLPAITCPVLVVTSRQDHVVPPVSSDLLAAAVSGPVERLFLERSFHLATLDVERDVVENTVVDFALRPCDDPVSSLSRDDVVHVAVLARLDLTEDEIDMFTGQLAAVLDHAASVAALDTASVEPTAHPLPIVNVLRDDVPRPSLKRGGVCRRAKAVEADRFKVPPILGDAP